MNSYNSRRDKSSDGLKFVMIFFVILGHLSYYDYGIGLYNIIYSFHMPVFIFLSGYYTSTNYDKKKQIKWLKKTLYIYAIAQLTHFLLRIILNCKYNSCSHINVYTIIDLLVSPEFALWYLVCLIYWRLIIWKSFTSISDIHLLWVSLAGVFLCGFIPIDYTFSFQRAFSFFPFFVIGNMFRNRNLTRTLERIPISVVLPALLIGLIVARYFPTYMPKFHYSNWHHPLIRIFQTVLGILLCLLIVRLSRIKFLANFANFGAHSLWIYIGHIYLITIGNYFYPQIGLTLNLFSAIAVALLYCVLFHIAAVLYGLYRKKVKNLHHL